MVCCGRSVIVRRMFLERSPCEQWATMLAKCVLFRPGDASDQVCRGGDVWLIYVSK